MALALIGAESLGGRLFYKGKQITARQARGMLAIHSKILNERSANAGKPQPVETAEKSTNA